MGKKEILIPLDESVDVLFGYSMVHGCACRYSGIRIVVGSAVLRAMGRHGGRRCCLQASEHMSVGLSGPPHAARRFLFVLGL
jgi:hypothetical protein